MNKRREQILILRKTGLSYRQIALQLNIGKTTVEYYCNNIKKYSQRLKERRRLIKRRLINMRGGKCEKCGYNKSIAALDFHHLKEDEKTFGIAKGVSFGYNFTRLSKEVEKCILLCSNCHHEIHENHSN